MTDARQVIAVWLYEDIGGYDPDDGVNHDEARELLEALGEIVPGDYIVIRKEDWKVMGGELEPMSFWQEVQTIEAWSAQRRFLCLVDPEGETDGE